MTERTKQMGGKDSIRESAIAMARRSLEQRRIEKEGASQASVPLNFSELPEYLEMKKMEAVGQLLSIKNPYFRVHEERASTTTKIDGSEIVNFGSYDYLCLNADARTGEAAIKAIKRYGISASASRLVAGERPIHRELEAALANFYGVEDAVVFVSGHATNVSTIGQILGSRDLVIHDSLAHNSIVNGALISGAARVSFPHNDLEMLEGILEKNRSSYDRVLIVVEGLYSMDGDTPNLPGLVNLKKKYSTWLMVDEAHAVGCLGDTGRGTAEYCGLDPNEVDIWMGTLSKALGSTGGYIAGSKALVEYLKGTAPGFVYSVGLSPPLAAAALCALELIDQEPERVRKLQENGTLFLKLAQQYGLDTGYSEGFSIIPIMVGNSMRACKLSERLLARGVNALPIIFPAVPMQSARLRFFINSGHTEEQIRLTIEILREELDILEKEKFGELEFGK